MPSLGRWLTRDPILIKMSPVDLIPIGILSESPYVYISNNPIIYIDRQGLIKWRVIGKGALKFTGGLLGTIASGYAIGQTGGVAAAFGGAFALTTSIGTMSFGLAEMLSGFADKDFPLTEGFIISVLTEAGVDKNTAQRAATIYDLLSVGTTAASAVSRTGSTLDELRLLLNVEELSEDIKKMIEEYIRQQEEVKNDNDNNTGEERQDERKNKNDKQKKKEEQKKRKKENNS